MDDYKEHLRRLAVHDDAFVELAPGEGNSRQLRQPSTTRTAALVRVAATIAVDAAPSSFQHAVALALAAGATKDEIVATPRGRDAGDGHCRESSRRAPKLALALGYDVEDALEQHDS